MIETVSLSHVAHSAQGLPRLMHRIAAMRQFLAFAMMEIVMVPRPRPSLDPRIADDAPTAPKLTNYDYELLICYLRLLDAEADGADWREVARVVLKSDPDRDYIRAKRRYDTHLARARWMTEHGYRHLLMEADDEW